MVLIFHRELLVYGAGLVEGQQEVSCLLTLDVLRVGN